MVQSSQKSKNDHIYEENSQKGVKSAYLEKREREYYRVFGCFWKSSFSNGSRIGVRPKVLQKEKGKTNGFLGVQSP